MDFQEFLRRKHLYIKNSKVLSEVSVKQYNSRLQNMFRKQIYKGEKQLNVSIVKDIKENYADRSGEYERTIRYYIAYLNHQEQKTVNQ